MTKPLTCVLCGAVADWRRPSKPKQKGMENEAGYCDEHTPPWRTSEYEPITTVAQQRKARAEAPLENDEPKPKTKRKKKTEVTA